MGAPGVPRYVAAGRADGEAWGGSATAERPWQIAELVLHLGARRGLRLFHQRLAHLTKNGIHRVHGHC